MSNSKGYQVTCDEDQYQYEDRCCSKCPAGSRVDKFCTDDTPTRCICPEGTFMKEKECVSCTSCSEGLQEKTSCSKELDTVCVPEEGYLCAKTVDNSCVEAKAHSHCDPGQYISQKGTADNDTVCSNCTVGTFSNGTLTVCQPHTLCASIFWQLLTPGTESEDAQCEPPTDLTVGLVLFFLVILVFFVVTIHCHRKRKRQQRGVRRRSLETNGGEEEESFH